MPLSADSIPIKTVKHPPIRQPVETNVSKLKTNNKPCFFGVCSSWSDRHCCAHSLCFPPWFLFDFDLVTLDPNQTHKQISQWTWCISRHVTFTLSTPLKQCHIPTGGLLRFYQCLTCFPRGKKTQSGSPTVIAKTCLARNGLGRCGTGITGATNAAAQVAVWSGVTSSWMCHDDHDVPQTETVHNCPKIVSININNLCQISGLWFQHCLDCRIGTEATATAAAMDVDTPGRVWDFKRDSHDFCKAIERQVCICAGGGVDEIT